MPIPLGALATALAGRYLVQQELGSGGMAAVFLAEDLVADRLVAIKVLRPELNLVRGRDRFQREIAILARLQHPNIVPIWDSGEVDLGPHGQTLYLVMPYVPGETLEMRMRRGPLGIPDALRIATETAAAIDAAHAADVVHRDIKPSNILLAGTGVMVCDFGVARALAPTDSNVISSSGAVIGTPHYMSPEQASGKRVDSRTDIYALGCVLFEMLVGEPPFTGATPQAVVARHLGDAPRSLRVVRAEIPASLEHAVHAALAKRPEDRPPTAQSVMRLANG